MAKKIKGKQKKLKKSGANKGSPARSASNRIPGSKGNVTALFEKAVRLFKQQQIPSCIETCQQIIGLQNDHGHALNLMAIAFGSAGTPKKGILYAEKAVGLAPRDTSLYANLALLQKESGDLVSARSTLMRARLIEPTNPKLLFSLANLEMMKDHISDAIELYEKALALMPENPDIINNLAQAYKKVGDWEKAGRQFKEALRLCPGRSGLYCNLANLYSEQQLSTDAEDVFSQGLKACPKAADLHYAFGQHCMRNLDFSDAKSALRTAFELASQDGSAACKEPDGDAPLGAIVACDLALTLVKLDDYEGAEEWANRSKSLAPQWAHPYYILGYAFRQQGRLQESTEAIHQFGALSDDRALFINDLLMTAIYDSTTTPDELLNLAKEHALCVTAAKQTNSFNHEVCSKDPGRIRVGFVSRDFRAHVISSFMQPLLQSLPPDTIEVHCYYDHASEDEVSRQIKTLVHSWKNISSLTDEQVSALIRQDEVQILIDLNSFADGARFKVFAQRAAPVQGTYLGWVATTGLSTMDFRITDPVLNGCGDADPYYVEKPAFLPNGFCCYSAPKNCPEVAPLPFDTNGFFTFGSFNHIAKMTDLTLSIWAAILQATPASILFLKNKAMGNPQIQNRIESAFERHGISKDRLRLQGFIPGYEQHMRLYNEVDLALDTFPYNSGTTFCDAAYMGVPTLTRAGELAHSRMSTSFLSSLELGTYSVDTDPAFVQRAAEIAKNPAELKTLRSQLRHRMTQSPIMDSHRIGVEFAEALKQIWHQHQETNNEAAFSKSSARL
jgi:protein O-GlcNAc transferase